MSFKTLLDLMPELARVTIVFNDDTLSGNVRAFEYLEDDVLKMKMVNIEARDNEVWAWLES